MVVVSIMSQITAEDRAVLRERRDAWVAQVTAIAVGVFVGVGAFAIVAYAIVRLWLESTF